MTSQTETPPSCYNLITREVLASALRKDLGEEWILDEFEIKDFAKKGDNYATKVTSVVCTAHSGEKKETQYYIVKLNPLRKYDIMEDMLVEMFEKEGLFFTQVSVKVNEILRDVRSTPIIFPQCLFHDSRMKQQILISKDLRIKGFKMFDMRLGLDLDHCVLTLKALAKLHASSIILKTKLTPKTILDSYPFLIDIVSHSLNSVREMFQIFLANSIDTSYKLLDTTNGYVKEKEWLKSLRDESFNIYLKMLTNTNSDIFKVICHGDCWNNNVLFGYDEDGKLEDVALLDLQMCRYNSFSLDLNYFFYTSLTPETRKTHEEDMLLMYYQELVNNLRAADLTMPFTMAELRKEFADKFMFGFLSALMVLPLITCKTEEVPDFDNISNDEMDDAMEDYGNTLVNMLSTNDVFRSRFLGMFDGIQEKVNLNQYN